MKKTLFILWYLGMTLSISACLQATLPPITFPMDLMLNANDLPSGWTQAKNAFEDIPNSAAFTVYYNVDDPQKTYMGISHTLAIYKDPSTANSAYPGWVKQWIVSDNWTDATDSWFAPIDKDDKFTLKCRNAHINGKLLRSCTYLQLHSNTVVLVLVNLDEYINMEQFNQVLKKLDEKLPDSKSIIPFRLMVIAKIKFIGDSLSSLKLRSPAPTWAGPNGPDRVGYITLPCRISHNRRPPQSEKLTRQPLATRLLARYYI